MWEKFFFVKIKAYLVESYDDKVIISIMKPCINDIYCSVRFDYDRTDTVIFCW